MFVFLVSSWQYPFLCLVLRLNNEYHNGNFRMGRREMRQSIENSSINKMYTIEYEVEDDEYVKICDR